ncbi:DUF1311 domain-containing protein [Paraburkholderia bonniea]|uniref:lysozyme inhibitor LprI family protein n=1 Tax=Paraburkholderia bonniea TaxID=2152891 RepID=UPI001FE8318F|nr:lysozyme inhibitor LprI family protein [Paraburkholderia bonniea]WJF89524.1 DUF1311 domain-containing protein [Paraburkholderia bonniea]WJF92839.1 DUF1311 domain-containing protein [Paraburkholderia bonniea]
MTWSRVAMLLVPLLAWAALLSPGAARAEVAAADPIDSAMRACLARADRSSTMGQVQCMEMAQAGWQTALDQAHQQLLAKLPATRRRGWDESQRRWQAWRDAETPMLGAVFATTQGTVYRLQAADMQLQPVRERALLLRRAALASDTRPRYRACSADASCRRASADVKRSLHKLRLELPAASRPVLDRAQRAWARYLDVTGRLVERDTRNDLLGTRLATLRRLLDAVGNN